MAMSTVAVSLVGMDRAATLRRLRAIAWALDARWRLPGTNFRFGVDAIVGLAPGVGDALMGLVSLYIVYEGVRLGASDRVVARMLLNILVEVLAGSVPIAGDLFDAAWKTNLRNLKLLGIEVRQP